jgi:hypothetical protein
VTEKTGGDAVVSAKEGKKGRFRVQLGDGTLYDETISALQKMIRRGLEEDALFVAIGLFDSGFGLALSRRLPIVASEDIGLASPETVTHVCMLCSTWIALRKESRNQPDSLPLIMAVMLMCRAPKNREVDDASVVVRERIKRGEKTVQDVITAHEGTVVDSHTDRGRERLRAIAKETGKTYEQLAWHQFYTEGAILSPRVDVNGNPWGHAAYKLFDLDYDQINSKE